MISINQPTVVLFDVDGTLIDCGGAGRRAMEATFRELDANTDALGFTFAGLTDRAIVRSGLRTLKRADDDDSIDGVIARYLEHLAAELPRSEGYRILAGVSELLGRLASIEGLVVGLGTGNVEPGARAKLRRGGLDRSFAFGGFGSDHEDRARLLEVGATRGAVALDVSRAACRVVVVGDTPRDVRAAHAIGAECVAVATGGYDQDALTNAGARRPLAALDAPEAFDAVVGAL